MKKPNISKGEKFLTIDENKFKIINEFASAYVLERADGAVMVVRKVVLHYNPHRLTNQEIDFLKLKKDSDCFRLGARGFKCTVDN